MEARGLCEAGSSERALVGREDASEGEKILGRRTSTSSNVPSGYGWHSKLDDRANEVCYGYAILKIQRS